MTLEICRDPVKMVDDISALGLRHVRFGIPTELFAPFVTVCVEVLQKTGCDDMAVVSFRWSLALVAKMLVQTITDGSTFAMKAFNNNSFKLLNRAISCAPRGEQATWLLNAQAGTLYQNAWLLLTLAVFITGQSFVQHFHEKCTNRKRGRGSAFLHAGSSSTCCA